jgi:predicted nuclease of predicted toxin-antitoxin system
MADIRYHLDEHIHNAIADGLRRRDVDVITSAEVELLHATDEEQLAFAVQNGRVLVTRDRDFLRIVSDGRSHAGIAIARQGRRVIGDTVLALAHLFRIRTAEEMANCIVFL